MFVSNSSSPRASDFSFEAYRLIDRCYATCNFARVNGVPTLARKSESAVFFPDDSQICGLGRERRHGESRSVGMINQSQTHRLPITPGRFLRFQQRAVEFGDQLVPLDR